MDRRPGNAGPFCFWDRASPCTQSPQHSAGQNRLWRDAQKKRTLTRRYLHCIAPLRGFTLSIAAPRERIATPKVTLR
jgi:hypothetical protein